MCGMETNAGSPKDGWIGREAVPFSRTFNMSSLIVKFSSAPPGKGRGSPGWDDVVNDTGAGFHLEWEAVKI